MKTKNIFKVIACICAIAIVAVCFTACGKIYASELALSTSEVTVKAGGNAFFALHADYLDDRTGTLELEDDIPVAKENEKPDSIIDIAATPTTSPTSTHGDIDGNETVVNNLDIGDGYYLCINEDYEDDVTVEALGEDLIKFIKENYTEPTDTSICTLNIYIIQANTDAEASEEKFTFSSGDLSAPITIITTK